MNLFISYARVDKSYCIQIVDTLEVHEVWYDQRLYAGFDWWKEILRRLDWCEGFVYLISADSLASKYCRKEFDLALSLGRRIIPVLIDANVELPEELATIQYIDFSKGITPDAVTGLLNSIYMAERQPPPPSDMAIVDGVDKLATDEIQQPASEMASLISAALAAMEKSQFDQAVYLFRQAKEKNLAPKFIDIDSLLKEALTGLERQSYLREAKREYDQIAELVRFPRTRAIGVNAFLAFRGAFPDYDPDELGTYCAEYTAALTVEDSSSEDPPDSPEQPERPPPPPPPSEPDIRIPLLEWCDIPAGRVLLHSADQAQGEGNWLEVGAFQIARYPVTNTQYQLFLDAPDGYSNERWWGFSEEAQKWRNENPTPRPSLFEGEERPREMVNWYDALAFCGWLGVKLGMKIRLPTAAEWIRAARGDEQWRYPWGDQFDAARCNTGESKMRQTAQVTRFADGQSQFGVVDLVGNVWEWTLDAKDQPGVFDLGGQWERAVHGGSYIGPASRAQISFSYYLKPHLHYSSIGFRIMRQL